MEPILSRLPAASGNVPRDLQLRLYREIGISAVAAALGVAVPPAQPAREPRVVAPRRAA